MCWARCFTANRKIFTGSAVCVNREGKLAANAGPLEQDDMLARLQKLRYHADFRTDYNALFVVGEGCAVAPIPQCVGRRRGRVWCALLTSRGDCRWPIRLPSRGTLLLAASGWKIRSAEDEEVKRWKPYLPIICFTVQYLLGQKLKPMPLRHSGALWRRTNA